MTKREQTKRNWSWQEQKYCIEIKVWEYYHTPPQWVPWTGLWSVLGQRSIRQPISSSPLPTLLLTMQQEITFLYLDYHTTTTHANLWWCLGVNVSGVWCWKVYLVVLQYCRDCRHTWCVSVSVSRRPASSPRLGHRSLNLCCSGHSLYPGHYQTTPSHPSNNDTASHYY